MVYQEWLQIWLELYVKPVVKVQTYEKYERNCRNHIVPLIGAYELNQLSACVLQKTAVELSSGLSAGSVNGVITVLRKSLKTAVAAHVCETQNSDAIIRPALEEKQVECFTLKEQKMIEKFVLESHKDSLFGIVFCLYSGLRIGELLSVTWQDIDFKNRTLNVNKSCHYGKDQSGKFGRITELPKTVGSKRIIPIPKPIIVYLKQMKARSCCEYVISSRGKGISTRSYQKTFERILIRLKIGHRGFHALRHTFATRAIESGMDVKTLSEILGHRNSTITLNRYVHSLIEHKNEMMNKLCKYCKL